MAIIKVTNPELYRAWLRYYAYHHPEWAGYEQRTYAFFNSEKGKRPQGNW